MQPVSNLIDNTEMNNDKYKAANSQIISKLNTLAETSNINPSEIARRSGVPQPTVHRILSGQSEDPKITIIRKIAECLGTSLAELEGNLTTATNTLTVPLIEWNQLTDDRASSLSPLIPCPSQHGPKTFATRVKDNTMTAQYGRSYPEGSIIYIDPDKAHEALPGDRVLAIIEGKIPSFKLYNEADGERYLQSINLQYPIITREFEIIGLVIGMWMPEN
jgi:SOS-response transcriptional repressor LexA